MPTSRCLWAGPPIPRQQAKRCAKAQRHPRAISSPPFPSSTSGVFRVDPYLCWLAGGCRHVIQKRIPQLLSQPRLYPSPLQGCRRRRAGFLGNRSRSCVHTRPWISTSAAEATTTRPWIRWGVVPAVERQGLGNRSGLCSISDCPGIHPLSGIRWVCLTLWPSGVFVLSPPTLNAPERKMGEKQHCG